MAWVKLYERIGWENVPSIKSPINDLNLNKIDIAVDGLDDRVIELQTTKAEQTDLLTSVKSWELDLTTGVVTVIQNNGVTKTYDTALEKIATNFTYDAATQSLILTLPDGTTQSIPLSAFITETEFLDSSTITFVVENGKVKANLIKGSITGDYLQPNYLADIIAQASLAGASATAAATSEANAAQSAQTASTKATEAGQSATTASTKADEANASATTASTKASEATTAAQTATTKASEASTSAQTATTKATEAATSASNASTSETNAQNSVAAAHVAAVEASASADRAEQAAQATEGVVKWSERKGYVGKNLLKYRDAAVTTTYNGITFTVNADKSITVNGTASGGDSNFILCQIDFGATSMIAPQTANGYTLSDGGVEGASENGYRLRYDGSNKYTFIGVRNGTTVNNVTFYPMMRYASIKNDTYEPYLTPNTEIDGKVSWSEVKGYLCKNLLSRPYWREYASGNPWKTGNLTFTVNDDGSVTVTGTASTTSSIIYFIKGSDYGYNNAIDFQAGAYKLNGFQGGSDSTYYLEVGAYKQDGTAYGFQRVTDGGEKTITVTENSRIVVVFIVKANAGEVNFTFYPMLRLASIQDGTYEPYSPTNTEIAAKAFSDVSWEEQNVLGAKNLIVDRTGARMQNVGDTYTHNGITYTLNDDHSITANGTATGASYCFVFQGNVTQPELKTGRDYILSGGVSNDAYVQYHVRNDSGQSSLNAYSFGRDATFTQADVTSHSNCTVQIRAGATVENITFKPMIRPVEVKNDTYAPPAMTNRELTEKVQEVNLPAFSAETDYLYMVGVGERVGAYATTKLKNIGDKIIGTAERTGYNNFGYIAQRTLSTRIDYTVFAVEKLLQGRWDTANNALVSAYRYNGAQLTGT